MCVCVCARMHACLHAHAHVCVLNRNHLILNVKNKSTITCDTVFSSALNIRILVFNQIVNYVASFWILFLQITFGHLLISPNDTCVVCKIKLKQESRE